MRGCQVPTLPQLQLVRIESRRHPGLFRAGGCVLGQLTGESLARSAAADQISIVLAANRVVAAVDLGACWLHGHRCCCATQPAGCCLHEDVKRWRAGG